MLSTFKTCKMKLQCMVTNKKQLNKARVERQMVGNNFICQPSCKPVGTLIANSKRMMPCADTYPPATARTLERHKHKQLPLEETIAIFPASHFNQ